MPVYFITGIDTDVGKTVAAGLLARETSGSVVTQKLVQTGHSGTISEDILTHRRLMAISPMTEDVDGTTCPYRFRFPASPHLAANREGVVIEPQRITAATNRLREKFKTVLLEGTGGFFVPLTSDYLTADYVQERGYPLYIVTSGKLGSVNHTLLTLEAAHCRNIPIAGIVFNHYPPSDEVIQQDSLTLFRRHCQTVIEIPIIDFKLEVQTIDCPQNDGRCGF